MIIHGCDDLEAVLRVERRRLERERHEHNLSAAASERFLFCRRKEACPESLLTTRCVDPELTDLEASAPRVSAQSGNDAAGRVLGEDPPPRPIGDASDTGV